MKNYLEIAIETYGEKRQWHSSESAWLLRIKDLEKKRIRGLFLKHHRQIAEVHLHITPVTYGTVTRTVPVFQLPFDWFYAPLAYSFTDTNPWQVHPFSEVAYGEFLLLYQQIIEKLEEKEKDG